MACVYVQWTTKNNDSLIVKWFKLQLRLHDTSSFTYYIKIYNLLYFLITFTINIYMLYLRSYSQISNTLYMIDKL